MYYFLLLLNSDKFSSLSPFTERWLNFDGSSLFLFWISSLRLLLFQPLDWLLFEYWLLRLILIFIQRCLSKLILRGVFLKVLRLLLALPVLFAWGWTARHESLFVHFQIDAFAISIGRLLIEKVVWRSAGNEVAHGARCVEVGLLPCGLKVGAKGLNSWLLREGWVHIEGWLWRHHRDWEAW